jgi:hypothetical protein
MLERLTKNFTILSVCNAVGIDRKTFYRWIAEDPEFKRQAYENIQESKRNITDMAYTQLVKLMNEGNLTAIMFWLNNKDPDINSRNINMSNEELRELLALLYNTETFKDGQEMLATHVLQGDIGEKQAQLILKLFIASMKAEHVVIRKKESEVLSEVLLRKKVNSLRKK